MTSTPTTTSGAPATATPGSTSRRLAPIRRTFTPADLRAERSPRAGVDRTVLVEGGRCDPAEAAVLLATPRATPEIAGVVAWADPARPTCRRSCAGYRALPGGDAPGRHPGPGAGRAGARLPRPRRTCAAACDAIGAAGLAYDLVVRVDQLPAAARAAARRCRDVRFVLDHLGKPRIRAGAAGFAEWRAADRAARRRART